jgi:hypothetical protein
VIVVRRCQAQEKQVITRMTLFLTDSLEAVCGLTPTSLLLANTALELEHNAARGHAFCYHFHLLSLYLIFCRH